LILGSKPNKNPAEFLLGFKAKQRELAAKKPTTALGGLASRLFNRIRFNFCCTAANITATLAASMAPPAMLMMTPAKDLPPAPLQSGTCNSPLAMAFGT
jgi:hypothetical protein